MAAAGHQVHLVVHARFESFVRENGLAFRPVVGDPQGILEGEAGQMWLASDRNPVKQMRRMMAVARPMLWQAADDYWAACQEADLILYPVLIALIANAISEKLGVPACPAYLQHVHPTGAYPSALLPPMPRLGAVYNRLTYGVGGELFWWSLRSSVSGWRQERLGLSALPWRSPFAEWNRNIRPCFYGFSPAVLPKPPEWVDKYTT